MLKTLSCQRHLSKKKFPVALLHHPPAGDGAKTYHYTFMPIEVSTPNFGVVKYSYIQAIVLPYVKQLSRMWHVSVDGKPFEVSEIFLFCFTFSAGSNFEPLLLVFPFIVSKNG